MADDMFDLGLEQFQQQINILVRDLDQMSEAVEAGAVEAANEAAEMIAAEQKRLLSAAHFKRRTSTNLPALIKVKKSSSKKYYRLNIGYDSETIKAHPEVLVIEYGRPGKSARRMKPTDKLGRKKGDFPPQTPHIKSGFILAKDKAAEHFRDSLLEIAKQKWNNGG
nr:MAG TPA: hypothetical protein [Caudoviricetes sp.]